MSLTKKDLKNIGSLMEEKLEPVKKDLKRVEIKVDGVDKKVSAVEQKVVELTEFVVPAIGNLLEWTDNIHRAIVGKPTKNPHGN